jgi:hypothetical protein
VWLELMREVGFEPSDIVDADQRTAFIGARLRPAGGRP